MHPEWRYFLVSSLFENKRNVKRICHIRTHFDFPGLENGIRKFHDKSIWRVSCILWVNSKTWMQNFQTHLGQLHWLRWHSLIWLWAASVKGEGSSCYTPLEMFFNLQLDSSSMNHWVNAWVTHQRSHKLFVATVCFIQLLSCKSTKFSMNLLDQWMIAFFLWILNINFST